MQRLLLSAALLVCLPPATGLAQNDPIDAALRQYEDTIIQLRHHIHQYPELGNREFKTAALLADHLRGLGIEVQTGVAHTGVVGILRGANRIRPPYR